MRYSVPILYEDTDVLVINKPAGLVVHSDGRTKEPTLVEWILKKYPKIKGVGDPVFVKDKARPTEQSFGRGLMIKPARRSLGAGGDSEGSLDRSGIVHRLDRETSGALIIAKNQNAFYFLKHQFKKQEVHKTYHAFVYGRVKNDNGLIDRPIARSRTNPVLWSATRGRKGEDREAITEYRVLGRLILPYQGEHSPTPPARGGVSAAADGVVGAARRGVHEPNDTSFSLLELYPRTGRTHQLRVHLKAINYPIVADKLYSKNEPALGFKRLALHSRLISFINPATGKRMTVEAPYPKDFKHALDRFI